MSDPVSHYAVIYSDRVLDALTRLGRAAQARGDGARFAEALRDFDRRLRVYPQFGDPLMDLHTHSGQVRLGVVLPLVMRYGVFEEPRRVIAAALPALLPRPARPSD